MTDTIDLYSDRGAKLKSGVDINDISPMRNAAIKKIVTGIKRTAAVDLAGIEKTLATSAIGGKGRKIPGREMKLDIVKKNSAKIQQAVADMVKVDSGDDTVVKALNGGKTINRSGSIRKNRCSSRICIIIDLRSISNNTGNNQSIQHRHVRCPNHQISRLGTVPTDT